MCAWSRTCWLASLFAMAVSCGTTDELPKVPSAWHATRRTSESESFCASARTAETLSLAFIWSRSMTAVRRTSALESPRSLAVSTVSTKELMRPAA